MGRRRHDDFDCNNNADPMQWSSKIGVRRALTSVEVRLMELAGGGDNPSSVGSVTLLPLESRIDGAQPHSFHWTFLDGQYRFDFEGGKWLE